MGVAAMKTILCSHVTMTPLTRTNKDDVNTISVNLDYKYGCKVT